MANHVLNLTKHMTVDILTQEFVQAAIEAEKTGVEFPIDFNNVWESTGYSRKGNAIRFLTERCDGLIENVHYQFSDRRTAAKGTPERLCYMTIDAFKFFLARCNTPEGDSALWHFIEVEKNYRKSLEVLFSAPSVELPANELIESLEKQLAQAKDDHVRFPVSLDHLHKTTRIVNKSQVKQAVIRDLVAGCDYDFIEDAIFLTFDAFVILCMSFRSMAGTDISNLPEILKVQTKEYFRIQQARMANTRTGKRDQPCPGQTVLEFRLN